MTDPRPLAERVRKIARDHKAWATGFARTPHSQLHHAKCAATLHEAADALEARKDQP